MAGATTYAEFFAQVRHTIQQEESFWVHSALARKHALAQVLKSARQTVITALSKGPPTGAQKSEYQTYCVDNFATLNKLSPMESNRSVIDTHNTAFLNGRRPDVTIYDGVNVPATPVLLIKAGLVVGEIKPISSTAGGFSDSAKGEIIIFGLRHLHKAPYATEVTIARNSNRRLPTT